MESPYTSINGCPLISSFLNSKFEEGTLELPLLKFLKYTCFPALIFFDDMLFLNSGNNALARISKENPIKRNRTNVKNKGLITRLLIFPPLLNIKTYTLKLEQEFPYDKNS
jgi:hypothetical protein